MTTFVKICLFLPTKMFLLQAHLFLHICIVDLVWCCSELNFTLIFFQLFKTPCQQCGFGEFNYFLWICDNRRAFVSAFLRRKLEAFLLLLKMLKFSLDLLVSMFLESTEKATHQVISTVLLLTRVWTCWQIAFMQMQL